MDNTHSEIKYLSNLTGALYEGSASRLADLIASGGGTVYPLFGKEGNPYLPEEVDKAFLVRRSNFKIEGTGTSPDEELIILQEVLRSNLGNPRFLLIIGYKHEDSKDYSQIIPFFTPF